MNNGFFRVSQKPWAGTREPTRLGGGAASCLALYFPCPSESQRSRCDTLDPSACQAASSNNKNNSSSNNNRSLRKPWVLRRAFSRWAPRAPSVHVTWKCFWNYLLRPRCSSAQSLVSLVAVYIRARCPPTVVIHKSWQLTRRILGWGLRKLVEPRRCGGGGVLL